jgi:ketosteroid isomerase-like protein
MKSIIINGMLSGCTIFMFACNSKTNADPAPLLADKEQIVIDKEQVKKEIQAKEDSFATVYNSGVPRNIGYYAEDATSFFQNRPPIVGKQAIVSFLYEGIQSKSDRISFKTNEVFVSNDGNMVLEIGYFKVVDSLNAPLNSGNYMSLFEKRNGQYVVVRDMSASDLPVK